jgi:hypothetical protein
MVDVSEKGRSGHGFSTKASLLICSSKAALSPSKGTLWETSGLTNPIPEPYLLIDRIERSV